MVIMWEKTIIICKNFHIGSRALEVRYIDFLKYYNFIEGP